MLTEGLSRSIPILFGWDWNPKNPIRSGGVWILRDTVYNWFAGLNEYNIYQTAFVLGPTCAAGCSEKWMACRIFPQHVRTPTWLSVTEPSKLTPEVGTALTSLPKPAVFEVLHRHVYLFELKQQVRVAVFERLPH